MLDTNKLALVIPAYKITYLAQTFDSIAQQTCRDFNLYVFDDASTDDLKSLYDSFFASWPNASYHRFDQNLGRTDLVGHWTRCLDLLGNEEWLWLFSDDDMMESDSMEMLQYVIRRADISEYDVVRFPLRIIDAQGRALSNYVTYPQQYTAAEFLGLRSFGYIHSTMQEFVLRRSKLTEMGGFIQYDLAWNTDTATVGVAIYPGRLYQMHQGGVSWRKGEINITCQNSDDLLSRKYLEWIKYYNWLYDFFESHNLKMGIRRRRRYCKYLLLRLPSNISHWQHAKNVASQLHDIRHPFHKAYLFFGVHCSTYQGKTVEPYSKE